LGYIRRLLSREAPPVYAPPQKPTTLDLTLPAQAFGHARSDEHFCSGGSALRASARQRQGQAARAAADPEVAAPRLWQVRREKESEDVT
jgi:hypothetical protein